MKNKTIFIIGGHFTPAISIYEQLEKHKIYNLYYIGVKHTILFDGALSQEYKYAKDNSIQFLSLNTGKLYRYLSISSIISFFKIPLGFIQSIYYILKYKPSAVISFGSYVSVPILISSNMFRIKTYSHIQTIKPGLSDRIGAKYSQKIFTSWQETNKYIQNKKKIIYTGNIIRDEIFNTKSNYFKIDKKYPLIYITGGNQGSHIINEIIFNNIEELLNKYTLIHQIGSNTIYNDFDRSMNIKNKLDIRLKKRYINEKNIWGDRVGEVLNKADIIIGRSGANTVYEILSLNKKAIFIPLTIGDKFDQIYNAKIAQNYSSTIDLINENNLNFEVLEEKIETLLSKSISKNKKSLPINAGKYISDYIIKSII